MGFPTIMYLSKAKMERFLNRKQKRLSITSIIPSISKNPSLEIQLQTRPEIIEKRDGNNWPPNDSLDIVIKYEKKLKKEGQIGTLNDFLNNNKYSCYKLKGTFCFDPNCNAHDSFKYFGPHSLKGHGIECTFVPEGTDKHVLVDMSFENIAGVSYKNESWHVWESGALHFFRGLESSGYYAIGLFTYEGEKEGFFAHCGILYFSNASRWVYEDKRLEETIYNDYLPTSK